MKAKFKKQWFLVLPSGHTINLNNVVDIVFENSIFIDGSEGKGAKVVMRDREFPVYTRTAEDGDYLWEFMQEHNIGKVS